MLTPATTTHLTSLLGIEDGRGALPRMEIVYESSSLRRTLALIDVAEYATVNIPSLGLLVYRCNHYRPRTDPLIIIRNAGHWYTKDAV